MYWFIRRVKSFKIWSEEAAIGTDRDFDTLVRAVKRPKRKISISSAKGSGLVLKFEKIKFSFDRKLH